MGRTNDGDINDGPKAEARHISLPRNLCQQLIRPIVVDRSQIIQNKNQVAGHAGFFSVRDQPSQCLKPFNVNCVRGRREHLFYQTIEYLKRSTKSAKQGATWYYSDFVLFAKPDQHCNCRIDVEFLIELSRFVAKFHHVLTFDDQFNTIQTKTSKCFEIESNKHNELDSLTEASLSQNLHCPCYSSDSGAKLACSRDFPKVNFLCLEDMSSHCCVPCLIDIKIGQITYDPMAIKEKVFEQTNKYKQLQEFGFRILGMKLDNDVKDKNFGIALESHDKVLCALGEFFTPLSEDRYKIVVLDRIIDRLTNLIDLFERLNINQLKFFSSSILIAYDNHRKTSSNTNQDLQALADSTRVVMIDFAHVFHVHNSTRTCDDRDYNYLFGLKKLNGFFKKLRGLYSN